jgi:hypothetical protein
VFVRTCKNYGPTLREDDMGGEMRNDYKILVGKPELKRPLGKPKRRWEDNVKLDLNRSVFVWTGFNWLGGAFANTVMQLWIP